MFVEVTGEKLVGCGAFLLPPPSIMGQRKVFCRQRIPESSCATKEILDIDIHIRSRNGGRKTMQPFGHKIWLTHRYNHGQ